MKSEGTSHRDCHSINRGPFIRLKFGTFELSVYGTLAAATVLAFSILLWIGRSRGLL
jgi:hypothetical protein